MRALKIAYSTLISPETFAIFCASIIWHLDVFPLDYYASYFDFPMAADLGLLLMPLGMVAFLVKKRSDLLFPMNAGESELLKWEGYQELTDIFWISVAWIILAAAVLIILFLGNFTQSGWGLLMLIACFVVVITSCASTLWAMDKKRRIFLQHNQSDYKL